MKTNPVTTRITGEATSTENVSDLRKRLVEKVIARINSAKFPETFLQGSLGFSMEYPFQGSQEDSLEIYSFDGEGRIAYKSRIGEFILNHTYTGTCGGRNYLPLPNILNSLLGTEPEKTFNQIIFRPKRGSDIEAFTIQPCDFYQDLRRQFSLAIANKVKDLNQRYQSQAAAKQKCEEQEKVERRARNEDALRAALDD